MGLARPLGSALLTKTPHLRTTSPEPHEHNFWLAAWSLLLLLLCSCLSSICLNFITLRMNSLICVHFSRLSSISTTVLSAVMSLSRLETDLLSLSNPSIAFQQTVSARGILGLGAQVGSEVFLSGEKLCHVVIHISVVSLEPPSDISYESPCPSAVRSGVLLSYGSYSFFLFVSFIWRPRF